MAQSTPSPVLRQEQFDTLRAIIYAHVGVHFPDSRKSVLESRLARRLGQLGLDDFTQYCQYLTFAPQRHEELDELISRATVNQTSFFREPEQVRFLSSELIPAMINARRAEKSLRVWSAACSTGEEAYTLAMLVHDALGDELPRWRVEILGTDYNLKSLEQGASACYHDESVRSIDPSTRAKHFTCDGPFWRVNKSVSSMVSFERHNLKDRLGAKRFGQWDAILCRNALIYFDQAMRARVVGTFVEQLRPDGWLMIGASESLDGLDLPLTPDKNLPVRCYRPALSVPTPSGQRQQQLRIA